MKHVLDIITKFHGVSQASERNIEDKRDEGNAPSFLVKLYNPQQ